MILFYLGWELSLAFAVFLIFFIRHLYCSKIQYYRVVRGKPNHFLVYLISSKVRCDFSTSKLANKGPQRSVLTDNDANRTKVNIKRTTNSPIFRSGWFALYERFSKANRRCLQTEPGGWSDADGVRVRDRILGRLQDDSVVIGGDNKRSRARRRWHDGTRRPPPAVQHQTDTIEPFCSNQSMQSLIVQTFATWRSCSCKSIRVLVLLQSPIRVWQKIALA